jgi:flagellar basal body-associated protein FliL
MGQEPDKKQKKERVINWELIISLIIVMGTITGSSLPLYLSSKSHIHEIQNEMKDFHGRLCTIEERTRGK